MKKFLSIIALSLIIGLSFTSCTEEEVKPVTGTDKAGGTGSVQMF